MPVLRVDAHFTVIESALKGYVKWRATSKSEASDVSLPAKLPSSVLATCVLGLTTFVESAAVDYGSRFRIMVQPAA